MPHRDVDQTRGERLPAILLWSGIGVAAVAVLVVLAGGGTGSLRFGVLLVGICVVLIAASMLLRTDPELHGLRAREYLSAEVGALRTEMHDRFAATGHGGFDHSGGFDPASSSDRSGSPVLAGGFDRGDFDHPGFDRAGFDRAGGFDHAAGYDRASDFDYEPAGREPVGHAAVGGRAADGDADEWDLSDYAASADELVGRDLGEAPDVEVAHPVRARAAVAVGGTGIGIGAVGGSGVSAVARVAGPPVDDFDTGPRGEHLTTAPGTGRARVPESVSPAAGPAPGRSSTSTGGIGIGATSVGSARVRPAGTAGVQPLRSTGTAAVPPLRPAGTAAMRPLRSAGAAGVQPLRSAGEAGVHPAGSAGMAVVRPLRPSGTAAVQPLRPAPSQPVRSAGTASVRPLRPAGAARVQPIQDAPYEDHYDDPEARPEPVTWSQKPEYEARRARRRHRADDADGYGLAGGYHATEGRVADGGIDWYSGR